MSHQSRFEELADRYVQSGTAEWGTMMGHRCLRRDGAFVAMVMPKEGHLVAKLTPEAVLARVEGGDGLPFAPAGKVFRAWVAVPDPGLWEEVLAEALG